MLYKILTEKEVDKKNIETIKELAGTGNFFSDNVTWAIPPALAALAAKENYSVARRQYHKSIEDFSDVYTVAGIGHDFYDNFSIDALEFKKITKFLIGDEDEEGDMAGHTNNKGVSRVGFKFMHRYNKTEKAWFLCMVACKIAVGDNDEIDAILNVEFDFAEHLSTPAGKKGYNLKSIGAITETDSIDAVDAKEYFDNMIYSGLTMENTGGNPVYTKAVKHIVFSYIEILQLFDHNGINYTDDAALANVRMCFSSITFENTDMSLALQWPHTIVIHLNKNGVDLITCHELLAAAKLKNSAADYGTMHPPADADKYRFPINIAE